MRSHTQVTEHAIYTRMPEIEQIHGSVQHHTFFLNFTAHTPSCFSMKKPEQTEQGARAPAGGLLGMVNDSL